jgi:hypothetical protein
MKWLAIVAIWAVLGVIYAAPIYIEVRAAQHGHMAWRIFSWGILTWLAPHARDRLARAPLFARW